jgi:hypothetical protein
MTPLDIADSAVKIGLGALISGVAAYLNAKLGHSREAAKVQSTRRRELLESVAEQIEVFTHVALKLWARISGIGITVAQGSHISEEQSERFSETVDELFNTFKQPVDRRGTSSSARRETRPAAGARIRRIDPVVPDCCHPRAKFQRRGQQTMAVSDPPGARSGVYRAKSCIPRTRRLTMRFSELRKLSRAGWLLRSSNSMKFQPQPSHASLRQSSLILVSLGLMTAASQADAFLLRHGNESRHLFSVKKISVLLLFRPGLPSAARAGEKGWFGFELN